MNQEPKMYYISSRYMGNCIHKMVKVGGADQFPKNYNQLLRRDSVAQWIPPYGAVATERAGLCYTTDAFRKAIENFFEHFSVPMTTAHFEKIDESIAKNSVSDEAGAVMLIEDLSDNDQVGLAMREVQAEKKPVVLSRPSLVERSKLASTTLLPTRTIESARNKLNRLSQGLFETLHQDKPLVGIDVEMFEHKHDIILEVGLSTISQGKLSTRHFIVEENRNYSNGQYVPDHRDIFHFGRSEILSLQQISEEIKKTLDSAHAMFGHAFGNDLRMLKLPQPLVQGLKILDTQDIHKLFAKAVSGDAKARTGLSTIAPYYLGSSALDLPYHNGGNDIEVTGRILLKQGNPSWVMEQYSDLADHNNRFQEELQKVSRENLSLCIARFKKHFKEACEFTGTDVLDLAESRPMQALDGFKLALDIKRRAEAVKMVHTGVPLLDHLCQMESRDQGVMDLVSAINESSIEYAKSYLESREVMAAPSAHRQMIRVALESEDFIKTLDLERFNELKKVIDNSKKVGKEDGVDL